ncbi:MAG: ATP-binding protein [Deltaproteobacteria bacterium]|nr:ATP-binding protein [Deltaproteobacteria bacterium]
MLHSVYDTLRPYLQRRGLTLQLYLPEEPVVVQCDAERLQQVVINLVENAMKYARDQGTVQLALARHAEHVEFSVTDDGPGIVSEEFATLFEMFQRGRPVDLFNTPGFGVGLAVCRCIVEAHGGEVIPENRPGTGARFTVRLPLQSPSAGANAAPPAQTVAQ